MKIESPTQLEILTYEDVGWKLGRDRRFEFQIVDGQITPELVLLLRDWLPAGVVSTVFSEPRDIFYVIPAKHDPSDVIPTCGCPFPGPTFSSKGK